MGCFPRNIFQTILEVNQRRTLANRQKNKKTKDHA